MKRSTAVVGALGVGAGLMYLLDPDKGRRRRALIEDQALHLSKMVKREFGKERRDLRNRTKGVIAETERLFDDQEVSEERLAARISSKIGRLTSHPHAIKVEVRDGHVKLSGPILANEVEDLLSAIQRMQGVEGIENKVEVHTAKESIPALQPNARTERSVRKKHSWRDPNLSPGLRLLSTATGLGCALYATRKRGVASSLVGAVGVELISIGLTNSFLEHSVGNGSNVVVIQKAIRIAAPPEKVYEVCAKPQNFPGFMSHVRKVRQVDGRRFCWTVDGVAGLPLIWKTEVIETAPNKLIRWRNPDVDSIQHDGEMRFERTEDNQTRLHIKLKYVPPTGYLGQVITRLFRSDPKAEIEDDLLRLRSFIETGKVPHDAYAETQKRRFRNMQIRQIMTKNPASLSPESNLQEVAKLMAEKNCGAIPIIDNGKPVGIITDRDIAVRAVAKGKTPLDSFAKDFMTKALLTLMPDASLEDCCQLMEKNQVRRMIVVDETGALSGIVAQADIARIAPDVETAELVKDISMTAGAAK